MHFPPNHLPEVVPIKLGKLKTKIKNGVFAFIIQLLVPIGAEKWFKNETPVYDNSVLSILIFDLPIGTSRSNTNIKMAFLKWYLDYKNGAPCFSFGGCQFFPRSSTGLYLPCAIIISPNFSVQNHCFQPKSVNITNLKLLQFFQFIELSNSEVTLICTAPQFISIQIVII